MAMSTSAGLAPQPCWSRFTQRERGMGVGGGGKEIVGLYDTNGGGEFEATVTSAPHKTKALRSMSGGVTGIVDGAQQLSLP